MGRQVKVRFMHTHSRTFHHSVPLIEASPYSGRSGGKSILLQLTDGSSQLLIWYTEE